MPGLILRENKFNVREEMHKGQSSHMPPSEAGKEVLLVYPFDSAADRGAASTE